jgi:peroxiredoxin
MIKVMKEPEIQSSDIPTLPDGGKDSAAAYQMYKSQYWEGVDFTDDRLLRTPVFHNKLKKYYEKIVVQQTDTIIKELDRMIEMCRPNPEMFKYIVWFSTYTFENSEIMGFDKIFVHIVDKYYVTGQATWVTPEIKEKIIKKSNKTKALLIGNIAPNMAMLDTNNQLVSMHHIQAKYTLLLFWDPDCSHCEHEIPIIVSFYNQNKEKYGLEVFAVCSDTTMAKMKSAIKKKKMNWINVDGPRTATGDYHEQYDIISTPVIYLLNERKEIIAKKLAASKIEVFLENYIKNPRKP